ncbi:cell wall hydrolase [Risungbinella massiliensis]|uniref:cell wall hydrolase n=1 Tax=Risungbinella massiliensis TaxID=1329796 RepID=UPI00069B1896
MFFNMFRGYSQADIQLLERVVFAEAQGEPYQGQVAVAAVILNRLKSPDFPNTISQIIYQPSAFESVTNGSIWWKQPNESAKRAVQDAINGSDPSGGALFFFNPRTATSPWVKNELVTIKTIGKHAFAIKKKKPPQRNGYTNNSYTYGNFNNGYNNGYNYDNYNNGYNNNGWQWERLPD